jgi:MoxR-like ATPase
MFKILVSYNSEDEEFEIAKKAATKSFATITQVLSHEELTAMQKEVETLYIDDAITAHIVRLVFATREPTKYGLPELENLIAYGASPRATIDMLKAVKASAYIRGNSEVTPVDIALCIKNVLRHRIVLSYDAQVDEVDVDDIIEILLKKIVLD